MAQNELISHTYKDMHKNTYNTYIHKTTQVGPTTLDVVTAIYSSN